MATTRVEGRRYHSKEANQSKLFTIRLAVGALMVGLGGLAFFSSRSASTGEAPPAIVSTSAPPSTTSPELVQAYYHANDSMSATATAAYEKNETVIFQPEGQFTQEVFDHVRESVFVVAVLSPNGDTFDSQVGTGWLVGTSPQSGDIVITGHQAQHILEMGSDDKVGIFRPGDPQLIIPRDCSVAKSDDQDIAIIRCWDPRFSQMKPLAYDPNYQPQEGDTILTVAIPGQMLNQSDAIKSSIVGDVAAVIDPSYEHPEYKVKGFSFEGTFTAGSSGGVLTTEKDGQSQAVAIETNISGIDENGANGLSQVPVLLGQLDATPHA